MRQTYEGRLWGRVPPGNPNWQEKTSDRLTFDVLLAEGMVPGD